MIMIWFFFGGVSILIFALVYMNHYFQNETREKKNLLLKGGAHSVKKDNVLPQRLDVLR